MIGKLRGAIEPGGAGWTLVDVNGVGYVVQCSAKTLAGLPAAGQLASLLIETHVREDQIVLFGFRDAAERAWFRLLNQVQGVGGRVALAILSALTPDELVRALAAQDKARLTQADGVGAKLATRVLSELKDKVGDLALGSEIKAAKGGEGAASGDAVSALVNLGYGRGEAFGAVVQAAERLGDAANVEALVRAGLKALAS
ncbi:MAG: Holliday junction branch migration protein RuvA [Alphaproteobacteria bacterium]|nr:Holliday junction branch migration protein RuvA [Alphaproteobacteria bacterium]